MTHINSISGTITLSDGTVSHFSITDNGWQQWGAVQERLGATVSALDALAESVVDEFIDSTPRCDVCNVTDEDADEWCGGCGNCVEHCQDEEPCLSYRIMRNTGIPPEQQGNVIYIRPVVASGTELPEWIDFDYYEGKRFDSDDDAARAFIAKAEADSRVSYIETETRAR